MGSAIFRGKVKAFLKKVKESKLYSLNQSNQQQPLSLDQPLLIDMVNEGRWAINNNLSGRKALPNFSDCIRTRGLEEAKPEAANVRRIEVL